MSMLIITGLPEARLAEIEARLRANGLSPALPASYGSIQTIEAWLERTQPSSEITAQAVLPGRVLELAVSEILLANIDQPWWASADARHVPVLDFWRELDSEIRFLLLFAEPGAYLAERYMHSGGKLDWQQTLLHWRQVTSLLLGFYLQNPSRCGASVLVQWQEFPSTAAQVLSGKVPDELLGPIEPLESTDSQLLWFCRQLVSGDAAVQQLWLEVEARFDAEASRREEGGLENQIRAYLNMREQLREQAATLAEEVELKTTAQNKAAAYEARLLESTVALEVAEADTRQLAQRLDETRRQGRLDTEALRGRIREMADAEESRRQEIEALERQLGDLMQQVQESRIEQSSLETLKRDNRLCLEQLYQVQEELERHYLLNHDLLDTTQSLEATLQRLSDRYPDVFDYTSASIIQPTPDTLSIKFSGLRVGALFIEALSINLIAAATGSAFVIPSGQAAADWTGTTAEPSLVLDITQADDADDRLRAAKLPTRAWRVIQRLPAATLCVLSEQGLIRPRWQGALAELREWLESPQLVWRWDEIELRNEQVNPDYEHLWIVLGGASFAGRYWSSFEFRIAAGHVKDRRFTGHLKYEFPETAEGSRQFEFWHPNVADDLGRRFELRFNLASDAFDTEVWNTLSTADQKAFLGLLIAIPAIIRTLQQQGCSISRSWMDWSEMNLRAVDLMLRLAQVRTENV